jgi:hypothetical protein
VIWDRGRDSNVFSHLINYGDPFRTKPDGAVQLLRSGASAPSEARIRCQPELRPLNEDAHEKAHRR